MFVYKPISNTLDLKGDKSIHYIIAWKSKVLFKSKLLSLYGTLLPNINFFIDKMGIQFNKTPLAVDQKNYATRNVNAYIIYDLDNWPRNSFNNFTFNFVWLVRLI